MTNQALCQCGCGRLAPIATMTNRKHGHVAGQPMRFIRGHVGYLNKRERLTPDLWTVTDRGYETPCWIWKGAVNKRTGYCRVRFQGRSHIAHRAVYEQEVGAIPTGLDIDHLCSQRDCVRPEHLEAVTRAENIRRSKTAKLTPTDVELVRQSSLSAPKIASLLGVNRRTVEDIRLGRTWR